MPLIDFTVFHISVEDVLGFIESKFLPRFCFAFFCYESCLRMRFFSFIWLSSSLVFLNLFSAFLYNIITSLQSLFHQGTVFLFNCELVLLMVLFAASNIM
jgi:hypothetical protein